MRTDLVLQAAVEQTLYEHRRDADTATARVELWLKMSQRQGAVQALRDAAGVSPFGGYWLRKRANRIAAGGAL